MLVLLIIFFIVLVGFKYVLYRKLQDIIDGLGAMTSGMSESDEVVSVFEGDLKGKKK